MIFSVSEKPSARENLLHSKLMQPRLHAGLVPRAALFAHLDAGLTKKVTLLSAPTGFGKTTLVSAWLAERAIPAAWVALDGNDNDPVRFWTYVISALRALDPALGKTALAALMASQPGSLQNILTLLINDLSLLSTQRVLVLEDYHVITAAEVHETLTLLLQHLPASLHLVLISRTEPPLPLAVLRARDELLEVDADRLRFTQAETEAFLHATVSPDLPSSAVAKLQERTEGWVAGLRLAALSLQNRSGQDAERVLESFSGSHRYVADYLTQEVFAAQPQAVQDFLLRTCFLSRLTGSLCSAVMETSADTTAVLEQLERANLFLVRLEHGGRNWYRYSPLFAESMQTLARSRLGEAGLRTVFEKASAWYEYQQLYDEAIEAALSAGMFEQALALVEKFIEVNSLNEMRTLTRWLERIPPVLLLRDPAVCLTYAQVILFTQDRYAPATALRIEPLLQAAEQAWQAAGEAPRLGQVLALRGMMLLWQGDFPRALGYVHQSLEKLAESDVFWRGISLLNAGTGELYGGRILAAQDRILEARALLGASQNAHGVLAATQMLAGIFYQQADFEQAAQLNQQILQDAVGGEAMLDDLGTARLELARIAYEQNDLPAAREHAAQALELAQQRANQVLQCDAAIRLVLIDAAEGNLAQARPALKALIAQLQNPSALRAARAAQALLSLRSGELDTPGTWQTGMADDPRVLFLQKEQEAFILARLHIARHQPQEALSLLEEFLRDAQEQGRVSSQVQGLCLQALAYAALEQPGPAGQALTRALTIGQARGLRRMFLDEGTPLATVLRTLLPGLSNRTLSLYASTLLHLFPSGAIPSPEVAPGAVAPVEPLSGQELRVLRLLAAGLSNPEIARELVVSTNTVKTQVKSIYRKLDVNSRDEARSVAKELKLL